MEYILVGFGWNVIGCKQIKQGFLGVNQLEVNNFKKQITELVEQHRNARIIPFVHWDYELEFYPQPLHRDLAHWAIEHGVYAVIGCHPHCVQDVEVYNGHIIVYSLGNFMFPNNYYFNGKLAFPQFTRKEYGLKLEERKLIEFAHDKKQNTIEIVDESTITNSTIEELDLGQRAYRKWFKEHRRKKKLLPIYDNPGETINSLKDGWVNLRAKVIYTMVNIGLKGAPK